MLQEVKHKRLWGVRLQQASPKLKKNRKRRREGKKEKLRKKGLNPTEIKKGERNHLQKKVNVTKRINLEKRKRQLGRNNRKGPVLGWNHLLNHRPYCIEPGAEFFYKMELLEGGGIKTIVKNVEIHLD
ncbi:hypothetical protein H5410_006869 [Solanum commersonii]|uniref:Uncharacterized protein n=1 Tax=Solanum commersonii TaxID=4109 RepID=A0A9J6ABI7_SOLCO|nr:hypothetical protein H5410_006869 [Solanum commersonii]